MTLYYYDPLFMEHRTGSHPENGGRLQPGVQRLEAAGLVARCTRPRWEPASLARLAAVHKPDYVDRVQAFAAAGGGQIEQDTLLSPKSYDVARLASGAVCDAVTRVCSGEDKQALCLVRPPGHHALPHDAMGFCLFNNAAVAAQVAIQEMQLERVMVIDWDVHHGNGTQDAFWENSQVGFYSIHRFPFYPGTGDSQETGSGPGLGTTVNVPVSFGTVAAEFRKGFADSLDRFAASFQPQLVILSAGFDAHRDDPVGSLGLDSEDYAPLTQTVLAIADQYADGKLVSVLEGGYNPRAVSECLEIHLKELLKHEE